MYAGISVCIHLPLTTGWCFRVSQSFPSLTFFLPPPFNTAQADLEPSDPPVSIQMCITSPVLWEFDPRTLCRLLVELYPQPASFLQKVRSPSVTQILAQGIILHQLSKWLELRVPVSIHSCSFYFYFYFSLKFTALEHSCFVIVWLVVFCSARNET